MAGDRLKSSTTKVRDTPKRSSSEIKKEAGEKKQQAKDLKSEAKQLRSEARSAKVREIKDKVRDIKNQAVEKAEGVAVKAADKLGRGYDKVKEVKNQAVEKFENKALSAARTLGDKYRQAQEFKNQTVDKVKNSAREFTDGLKQFGSELKKEAMAEFKMHGDNLKAGYEKGVSAANDWMNNKKESVSDKINTAKEFGEKIKNGAEQRVEQFKQRRIDKKEAPQRVKEMGEAMSKMAEQIADLQKQLKAQSDSAKNQSE